MPSPAGAVSPQLHEGRILERLSIKAAEGSTRVS